MDDSMSTHKTNSKNAKNSKKKRSAALLAAGVIGLATAGGAYAYWTSPGGGTGTATTAGGTTTALVVTGNVPNAMFPGDAAQTVTATVKNTGTENYKLQSVKAYVTTNKTDCDGSNYLLNGNAAPTTSDSAVTIDVASADVAPAATKTGTFTMQFNNKSDTNQDACKGAAVTIHYVAN
jgi:copper(I)-binding protein